MEDMLLLGGGMVTSHIILVLGEDRVGAEELGCQLGRTEGIRIFLWVPENEVTGMVLVLEEGGGCSQPCVTESALKLLSRVGIALSVT